MNSWSRRRKRLIFLIVFLTLIIVVGIPTYFLFYRAPTCFDSKMNGNETGVDCGGSCQLLCTAESLPLIIRGDPQLIKITDNMYEAVVLVDNPNATGEIYRAGYIFRLYEASSSLPIKNIEGSTYIPKGVKTAIFEGPFEIDGGKIPARIAFEWKKETLVWQQNKNNPPELVIRNENLSRTETQPRLDATLYNASLENVSNINLVALIYDDRGTIFAASKTYVDKLAPNAEVPVVFSWPQSFKKQSVDTDVIVRVFPDGSFIR